MNHNLYQIIDQNCITGQVLQAQVSWEMKCQLLLSPVLLEPHCVPLLHSRFSPSLCSLPQTWRICNCRQSSAVITLFGQRMNVILIILFHHIYTFKGKNPKPTTKHLPCGRQERHKADEKGMHKKCKSPRTILIGLECNKTAQIQAAFFTQSRYSFQSI